MYRLGIIILLFCDRIATFDIDYIGNFTNVGDNRNLCDSKICLMDSNRLLLAASQNFTNPCEDFKEFSLGSLIKYRALHDRYERVGFFHDVEMLHYERLRNVLAVPVESDEVLPFKVAKSFFQKCTNSNYIQRHGKLQVFSYLNNLGHFPLITKNSFDQSLFNLPEIISKDPLAFEFLTNYYVARCPDPRREGAEIVCLKLVSPRDISKPKLKFIHQLMKDNLNKREEEIKLALKDFFGYFRYQKKIISEKSMQRNFLIATAETLPTYFNASQELNVEWRKLFNHFLMESSHIDGASQVLIEYPEVFNQSLKFMIKTPSRILSNAITIQFLYGHNHMFEVYPFDRNFIAKAKRKDLQRFESCLQILQTFMAPAMQSLFSRKYFQRDVQKSAENFATEAIEDVLYEIQFNLHMNVAAKLDLLNKMKDMKVIAGFPRFIMRANEIEEFYDGMNVDGSEELLQTYINIITYNRKIHNEPRFSWKKEKEALVTNTQIKYISSTNSLYIPPVFIHFPFFHPMRPRYFNTANLFLEISIALIDGIEKYLRQRWKQEISMNIDAVELSFGNYKRWEAWGGKDLQLGGFLMTNQQMFWFTLAHRYFSKYHLGSNYVRHRHQSEFLHLWFKNRESFRKSFHCDDLTNDENKKLQEILSL